MRHRCKECTLLRVEREGDTCEECIANGAYPLSPSAPSYTLTFASDTPRPGTPTNSWYDAVHGLYP